MSLITADPAPGDAASKPVLPSHIEETIQAITALHADHRRRATPTERILHRLTLLVAKPRFLAGLTVAIALWTGGNLAAQQLGYPVVDAPPFFWMDTVFSAGALYITAIILASQRRENQLSNLREQLTLELAILSEQKTAKTIQLLEELRRDSPNIHNRVDHEAEAMAQPANPHSVIEAIKETEAEAELLDTALLPPGEA